MIIMRYCRDDTDGFKAESPECSEKYPSLDQLVSRMNRFPRASKVANAVDPTDAIRTLPNATTSRDLHVVEPHVPSQFYTKRLACLSETQT